MKLIKKDEICVKKSRFIGYLYQIESADDVKIIINNLKSEHKKSNHIPYAYLLTNSAGKSDDGEPSNTASKPIYDLLNYHQLTNHLIVIVRYFGGTKLGAGNLLRTYLACAKLLVNKKEQ